MELYGHRTTYIILRNTHESSPRSAIVFFFFSAISKLMKNKDRYYLLLPSCSQFRHLFHIPTDTTHKLPIEAKLL